MNSFKRKLRKLKRDPKLFFRDSILGRCAKFILGVEGGGSTGADEKKRPDFFCSVGNRGAIEFTPNGLGARGFRTALIVPRELANFPMESVTVHYQKDFAPLSESCLNIGYFDNVFDAHLSEVSLINRISLKSKQEMEKVDVIFLLDASANLVNVIGACAPHLRVVTMVTSADYLIGLDSRMVAAVVLVGCEADTTGVRTLRCLHVDELYFQMRRLVQEQSPKSPNYLLPIRGGLDGFVGIASFDTQKFGGVVLSSGVPVQKGRSFAEYLKSLDASISDLWLSESVYLRYKTQCEVIEAGGASDLFFAKALADGVLFDVRASVESNHV